MRIMWVANIPLPIISEKEGLNKNVFGGWLVNTADKLSAMSDIQFCYVFPNEKGTIKGATDNFVYHGFKSIVDGVENEALTTYFAGVITEFQPDVIHIWGTEYAHALSMVRASQACGKIASTVVSLQGICYLYEEAYYANVPRWVYATKTLVEIKNSKLGLKAGKENFAKKAITERLALQNVNNVIGRTAWDKAAALAVNHDLRYFVCNENLREEFYHSAMWEYDKCDKHTIFVSQATYPIKGLHKLIAISGELLKRYPDFRIRVTGRDFIRHGVHDILRYGNYQLYLARLIKKNKMQGHIDYLGQLDATAMRAEYLRTNVFASVASIENSPNSVGEAMILGTPIVCSDVGGCASVIKYGEECLAHEFNDTDKLFANICQLFDDKELCEKLGKKAHARAVKTHDVDKNMTDMLNIYHSLMKDKK